MQIYVLDADLETVGLIDAYRSLIWTSRYVELGDCELYVPATTENIQLLQIGRYLQRLDDDMICRIVKRELQTDVENGDYLIVTGQDARGLFDQRIVRYKRFTGASSAEHQLYVLLWSAEDPSSERRFKKSNGTSLIDTADEKSFADTLECEVSFRNVGELMRELLLSLGWGYKASLQNGKLIFEIYKGEDRTDSVIFSEDFENLATTDYIQDWTNLGNVAIIAGEGEGNNRNVVGVGSETGINRYEVYIDARDLSATVSTLEMQGYFPNGAKYTPDSGTTYYYRIPTITVPIYGNGASLEAKWQLKYPTGTVTQDASGNLWFTVTNYDVANVTNVMSGGYILYGDQFTVELDELAYVYTLTQRGADRMSEYGAVTSFSGEIEPNVTFEYKKDYFLGDLVTVESPYGVSAAVRITEVLEVDDENGYRVEPIFELKTEV